MRLDSCLQAFNYTYGRPFRATREPANISYRLHRDWHGGDREDDLNAADQLDLRRKEVITNLEQADGQYLKGYYTI